MANEYKQLSLIAEERNTYESPAVGRKQRRSVKVYTKELLIEALRGIRDRGWILGC